MMQIAVYGRTYVLPNCSLSQRHVEYGIASSLCYDHHNVMLLMLLLLLFMLFATYIYKYTYAHAREPS